MKNVALITGINGQDGSYLAEFLLEKGYEVHGLVRRHSISVTSRIDHLIHSPYNNVKFFLHYADTTDSSALMRIMAEIRPTEVYNLAAQSHVGPSVSRGLCTVHSSRTLCTGSRTTVRTARPCHTASNRYTGAELPSTPMYL